MQLRYYIDSAHNTLILKFIGRLAYEGWYKGTLAIWDDADYHQSFNSIADFRDCEIAFSTQELKQMVYLMQKEDLKAPRGKGVILVSAPMTAAFGMLFSENLKNTFPAELTTREESALEHLGIKSDIFKEVNSEKAKVFTFDR